MSVSHSNWKVVLGLLLVLLALPMARADEVSTRLVVFGDSLSDPGNFYAAFGLSSQAPYSIVPSAPYTIGGHHFTNGKTWAEQLAARLHSPASGLPALLGPGINTNFAVGGARARPNAAAFPYYDLTTQVGIYLAAFQGRADGAAIHVVWFGGNDLRDALGAAAGDPTLATSEAILGEAIQSTASNILSLWAAGARLFLVPNAPDLSRTPVIEALGPAAVGGALQLTAAYNAALGQALAQLDGLPGIRLIRLDDFALLDAVVANPESFGLENGTTPCLHFGVVIEAVCEEPREHLFWDGIHPTTAGHAIVAGAALRALSTAGAIGR
jgi:phospholipase/lecithinase/hemolysin